MASTNQTWKASDKFNQMFNTANRFVDQKEASNPFVDAGMAEDHARTKEDAEQTEDSPSSDAS